MKKLVVAQFECSFNSGRKGGHGYTEEFQKKLKFRESPPE